MEPIASATGLVQGYGRNIIISGLDLDISRSVIGLLGPNGAGKTTLLRTLATVVPPRHGKLTICGEVIDSEKSARRARRNIGYLPQEFGYYPSFSVRDFVRYSAWLRSVPRAQADSETERAIAAVGLADKAGTRLKSLSGGMLQRAGIACAIVGSPKLLLLDEPTVGLDPAQRLDFRNLIRSFADTAVVLSTHLVEDVAAVCDEVIVMSHGTSLFRGAPAELNGQGRPDGIGDNDLERGYMAVLGQGEVAA